MKKYTKSVLAVGVGTYVFIAGMAFLLGISKPLQGLRDMFYPISNGYYLGIKQDYDFKTIYDDDYIDMGAITYQYNPEYIGKFRSNSAWFLNMFGVGAGIGIVASGLNRSRRSR